MTTTAPDYKKFMLEKQEIKLLKAARTRCWGVWVKTLCLGPIGSIWQSAVTGNWAPTAVATGVAAVTLPLAVVDLGLTFGFAPPITAAAMFTAKAKSARNKFQYMMPEQAEAALAEKGIF